MPMELHAWLGRGQARIAISLAMPHISDTHIPSYGNVEAPANELRLWGSGEDDGEDVRRIAWL